MSTESIINRIKTGLKGEPESDIKYLTTQLFKYKDNDSYTDIAREIGVLIYDALPENEKADFSHALYGKEDKKKILDEAYEMLLADKFLNAQIILGEELKNIRRHERDKAECVYLSLNTFFELCVYTEICNKGIAVRPTPFDYNLFYKLYSFALFKQNRIEEAKKALEEAVFWNPVSAACLLDLAEIYKIEKEFEKMADVSKKCLLYAYDKHNISRCYRNLGYYYIEKEDYDTAICLYVMANEYEESQQTVNELSKIISITGKKLKKPSSSEVKERLEQKNIQFGANAEIIKIAVGIGNNARDNGDTECAEYCYNVVFGLTGDLSVMKNVRRLKNEIAKKAQELKK